MHFLVFFGDVHQLWVVFLSIIVVRVEAVEQKVCACFRAELVAPLEKGYFMGESALFEPLLKESLS